MIAQLAQSDKPREQHIQLLWTKQMKIIHTEGEGIALTAYRIRITYVNLIQVSELC